jgi:HD-like signal output (HDOD) protein/CRP-like cAMP-binding protein
MGFLRSLVAPAAKLPAKAPVAITQSKLSFEGLSERDSLLLHSSAKLKTYGSGETVFQGVQNRNFYIVTEGTVGVSVTTDNGKGLPALYFAGDCISPFQDSSAAPATAECRSTATLAEITPAAFQLLPDKLQVWIHQKANRALIRIQSSLVQGRLESERRNGILTLYVENELAKTRSVVFSDFVQSFIKKTPRLPVFVMELAAKLLDENTSVPDVVASIKRDPAVAADLLKTVNSAMYGFTHKIENFYHACVVLGFDNIYQLVMRDALRTVVPSNAETRMVHGHSCVVSALCYETAMATGGKIHPQTAMTYGLLHEIGSSVIWLMRAEKAVAPEFTSLLDTGKIGSDLLQQWGLPDRICRIVELQRYPEFAGPEMIDSEFRQDLAVLHLAHFFERLLSGEAPAPAARVHTPAYFKELGLGAKTPEDFFTTHIGPALSRNKQRYGVEVRTAIEKFEEASKSSDSST